MNVACLVLGIVWVGLTGVTTLPNLLAGYVLGWGVLTLLWRRPGPGPHIRVWRIARLAVYFLWELILANLRVAWEVATPRFGMRPGVVGVPLDARTDAEITILANLITLTPGTLSLDVSEDRHTLFVHVLHLGDRDAFVRSIKDGFERRLLEAMR
ncbi:MAG: Na+/H+ antiporter subunit E [Vicinamibacterales bacterium]